MKKEKISLLKRWIGQGARKEDKRSAVFAHPGLENSFGGHAVFESPLMSSCYDKNAVVYRCLTLIARNIASIPLTLHQGGQRMETHPVLEILRKPNPMQNYTSFCEAIVTYLLLSGNSYIQAVSRNDSDEEPSELHVLRPDRVRIIPGHQFSPKAYEYSLGNKRYTLAVDPDTGASAILHLQLFNPLDDYLGISPIRAAKSMIDLQNVIVAHNVSLLQNAGCPSGALMLKGSQLTPEQEASLYQQVQTMKARGGAGTMLMLSGDFEWKEMGIRPKDMDFNEGRTMAAREIAQVFGVPPMCIGILGDSTYSNYQEARLHLWEDTCLPLFDMILGHLNSWLLPYYGPDLTLSYSKDDIHALIPRREKMWEKVCKITCLTINERREMLGYAPIPGGDILDEHPPQSPMVQENPQDSTKGAHRHV